MSDFIDFIIIAARLLFTYIAAPVLVLIIVTKIFQYLGSKSGNSPASEWINTEFLPVKSDVGFDDIAGIDEVKSELLEILDFMKNPKKYTDIGAKTPKGIIFYGEPGTGKTLLAKALSKESDLPFYFVSGSEFEEMLIGAGAKKVRALFEQARKTGGVIFIDEIDSVAGSRQSAMGLSDSERIRTLNQILTEMDGFNSTHNILVVAATNRLDSLDKAILRPGRFDRHVAVPLPGVKGRKEILELYLSKYKIVDGIDIDSLVNSTTGFAGADIANLINEAAIAAVRENKPQIEQSHIEYAWEKIIAGLPDASKVIDEQTKYRIAIHEIGHAIVATELKTGKLEKISILPRGSGALGYNLIVPEDKYLLTKDDVISQIAALMGGAMAERLIFGNTSNGLSDDLSKATQLAKDAIAKWGMGEYLISIEKPENSKEIADFVDLGIIRAYKILEAKKESLLSEASNLLEKEVIDGSEFLSRFLEKKLVVSLDG